MGERSWARNGRAECGATTRSGSPCKLPAGHGTPSQFGRCKLHGGCTPSHVKHAKRLEAESAVQTFGVPRDVDPEVALLEEIHRTAGHVEWLGQKVAGLSDGEVESTVWHDIYRQERGHLARVSKAAIDAGLAERRVRVAEEQGRLLAGAIKGILSDLQLSPLQQDMARIVVRRHLMALASGDVPDQDDVSGVPDVAPPVASLGPGDGDGHRGRLRPVESTEVQEEPPDGAS